MSNAYQTFQTLIFDCGTINAKEPVRIIPFGDIHRDSHCCDVDRWKAFLKKAKKEHTPQTFYIGMGDYNDFASYSERKKMDSLHESTNAKLDKVAAQDVARLCDELSFMKGNLIGLIHGNHEWKFQDGELATEKMCEILECPFLGWVCYVHIVGTTMRRTKKLVVADIFASHGKGGGRLLGSTINGVERMSDIFHDADIYLMGHDHKKGGLSKSVLRFDTHMGSGVVKQKRQWFARSGSFLRGYVEDTPSYVAGALYPPTDLGTVEFEVSFIRNRKDGEDTMHRDVGIKF